jgi:beta-1,4-mannosyltransferase
VRITWQLAPAAEPLSPTPKLVQTSPSPPITIPSPLMDILTSPITLWVLPPLVLLSTFFTTLLLLLPPRYTSNGRRHIVVLVLGDIGRSPRMQYHALSIARNNSHVSLIGYNETTPRPELLENKNITILPLPVPPKWMNTSTPLRFIAFAPFKAVFQLCSLFNILLYKIPNNASHILLQNPPSIPTMFAAYVVGKLRGQSVVIDWHNFGWSILRLKLKDHPLVLFSKLYEYIFAHTADAHFTVTHAFTAHLRGKWGLGKAAKIHTLHDRPPAHFQPFDAQQREDFLHTHPALRKHAEKIIKGEMKFIVTSTSWTADEDFTLFLSAILGYDRWITAENFLRPGSYPSLLVIITGRGPMRIPYLHTIESLELQNTVIESVWLEAEDYPKMIASADLGISLHTSSSGLDLPMKVVDLFGVGVPVAAVRFECLGELVKEGENGVMFDDDKGLEEVLQQLFVKEPEMLERLRKGARKETEGDKRWDTNWDKVAKGVLGL